MKHKKINKMILMAIKAEMKNQHISHNSLAIDMEPHVSYATTMQYLSGRHDMRANRVGWLLDYLGLEIRISNDKETNSKAN